MQFGGRWLSGHLPLVRGCGLGAVSVVDTTATPASCILRRPVMDGGVQEGRRGGGGGGGGGGRE